MKVRVSIASKCLFHGCVCVCVMDCTCIYYGAVWSKNSESLSRAMGIHVNARQRVQRKDIRTWIFKDNCLLLAEFQALKHRKIQPFAYEHRTKYVLGKIHEA